MSKVISFRLTPENPREAEALTILQDRLSQGFSTRHTMTEAILNLDSANSEVTDNGVLNDLSQQIKELLDSFRVDEALNKLNDDKPPKEELSDRFVTSILKTAKPGLRSEE